MFRPFGTTTGTASSFGTPQPQQNTSFGFGTPAFGGTGQSTFGSTGTAFGQPSGFASSAPRYSTTTDNENNITITLQTITAMPAYASKGLEELRLEDYLAGRKGGSGAFGAIGGSVPSGGFGGITANPATPFGTTSTSALATANPFGGSGGGGLFGNQPTTSTFVGSSGNLFGSNTAQSAPTAQPTTLAFGTFGQPAPSTGTGTGNLFGTSTAAAPTATTGPFGAAPTGGFTAFGKPALGGTTGGFGTSTTTGGTPSSSGMFGQSGSSNLFGSTVPSTSQFGTTSGTTGTAAAPSTSSNLFGKPSGAFSFGQPTTTGTSSGGGFGSGGLFGQAPAAQSTQQATGTAFSFGGTTAPTTGGFTFGATQPSGLSTTTATGVPSSFNFQVPTAVATAPGTTSGFSFGTGLGGQAQPTTTASGFSFGATVPGQQPSSTVPIAPTFTFGQNPPFGSTMATGTNHSAIPSGLPLISADVLSIKPPIPPILATPNETLTATSIDKTKITSISRSPARFTPRSSFRLRPPAEAMQPPTVTATNGSIITTMGYVLPKKVSAKKLVIQGQDVNLNRTETSSRLFSRVSSVESLGSGGEKVFGSPPLTQVLPETIKDGDKYMMPSESTLRKLPYAQLSAVQNFTIGARGIGQVRFLQPADLTKVILSDIFERIVVFEPRMITLYPDEEFDDEEKPTVGFGLNLPAEIRLERCWCLNKSDRRPVKDMGDSRLQSHIERLKSMPDTHFVDYLPETGTWIFKVDHFSSYGFTESTRVEVDGDRRKIIKFSKGDWEQLTFLIAEEEKKFNFCWLKDGSGLIYRSGATSISTVLAPISRVQDPSIESILDLIDHIKNRTLSEWLYNQLKTYVIQGDLMAKILHVELADLNELLRATGLEQIQFMASLRSNAFTTPHYNQILSSIAYIQLELLPTEENELIKVQRLVLELISGKPYDVSIPWEGILLILIKYLSRSLAEAIHIIPNQGDLNLGIIKYTGGADASELLVSLPRLSLNGDWSKSYAVCKSLGLDTDPRFSHVFSRIRLNFAAQLLAIGEWQYSRQLIRFDIAPFVLTDQEQHDRLTPAHSMLYHEKLDSLIKVIDSHILDRALADKYHYVGDLNNEFVHLIKCRDWYDAQQAALPLLVDAIIINDESSIEKVIQRIPKEYWGRVFFLLGTFVMISKGEDYTLEELEKAIAFLSEMVPHTLKEKAAYCRLATTFYRRYPTKSLLHFVPIDKQLEFVHSIAYQ